MQSYFKANGDSQKNTPISQTLPMDITFPPDNSCSFAAAASQEPCTIVIFGASGDLTARKLLPALFNLFVSDNLPKPFSIVGCSRTVLTDEAFRTKLREACDESGTKECKKWPEFAANLHYQQVTYDSQPDYAALAEYLRKLDDQKNTGGNRIFYLAVPPTLYPLIAEKLGDAGLAEEKNDKNGWSRIVVEKPFGRDLQTAMDLDRTIHKNFKEHQVFRIDHYLAKETVQNILMLRFANTIFEPLWNRNHIDYVAIVAAENLGVEHRAGYYEQAGVIRDMFQNHLMQLLALTAMEPPSHFESAMVQDEKVKIFRSLKPYTPENLPDSLILGQYGSGTINDRNVPAYREEPGVNPHSLTPTFALLRLFIDNWRWRDVPFYLLSGKRLNHKVTKIIVQFKRVPHSMFRDVLDERIIANRLILGVFPEEEISLSFQAKMPSSRACLHSVNMNYHYGESSGGPTLGAYEKVLADCIQGDHMLFWRQDGVELTWSLLTPILFECEECAAREYPVHPYTAGSWGPEAAQKWTRLFID
jgi:glucose-6-phosphate 1-dehydrogenase